MATKKSKRKAPAPPRRSAMWEARNQMYVALRTHIGHEIECVCYASDGMADPENVALECVTCGTVLLDASHPDREE